MKKTLLFLSTMVLSLAMTANAAPVVIKASEAFGTTTVSDLSTLGEQTFNGYTFKWTVGNSTNKPQYNGSYAEIRMYGGKSATVLDGNTFTVKGSGLTKIVLNGSTSSFKYGELQASTGSVEYDATSSTATWTSTAAVDSVTFTCCRSAAATSTSTQFRYTTITIGEGEVVNEVKKLASVEEFYKTAKDDTVQFTGKLNVVYQNGNNLFVTDATNYTALIYGATGKTFQNGNVIPAGLKALVSIYSSVLQLVAPFTFPEGEVGTTTVDPLEVTVAGATSVTPYQYRYVKFSGVKFTDDTVNYKGKIRYYQLVDGDNTLTAYDSYLVNQASSSATARNVELVEGATYNVIGLLSTYSSKPQLNLISFEVASSSGVDAVVADENTPAAYYTIGGAKVNGNNLTPGVYVKVQGNKATKVLVK